jgi:hypothetical protein
MRRDAIKGDNVEKSLAREITKRPLEIDSITADERAIFKRGFRDSAAIKRHLTRDRHEI